MSSSGIPPKGLWQVVNNTSKTGSQMTFVMPNDAVFQGNLTLPSNITLPSNTTFPNPAVIPQISGGTTFSGNILPSQNQTYDIGSSTNYWEQLFINQINVSNNVGFLMNGGGNGIIQLDGRSMSSVGDIFTLRPQNNGQGGVVVGCPWVSGTNDSTPAMLVLQNPTNGDVASTIVNSKQPAFQTVLTSSVSSSTGDGTPVTVICDTVNFDQASNYNKATGTFTAPVGGIYSFSGQVSISGYIGSVGYSTTKVGLGINSSAYWYYIVDKSCNHDDGGLETYNFTKMLKLNKNDTVNLVVACYDTTKTLNVYGVSWSQSYTATMFEGHLVC